MPNSPILFGPNRTANNLQTAILGSDGALLNANGPKNYIRNATFENGLSTGWSLGNTGTVNANTSYPTGSPTFGSGVLGTLTLATVTSGALAGTTSLSLNCASGSTGDCLATDPLTLDIADQAKVLTFSFNYKLAAGAINFPGTIFNTIGVAVYDVTNSAWLSTVGTFNFTQTSGVGVCTGTVQTGATTASLRLVIYETPNPGVWTLYFDQFYLGPQTASQAPAMSDWVSYTSTWSSAVTPPAIGNGTISAGWRRTGKNMQVRIDVLTGTTTTYGSANAWTFSLPSGYVVDTTVVGGLTTVSQVGTANARNTSSLTFFTGSVVANIGGLTVSVADTSGNNTFWQSTLPGTWTASSANQTVSLQFEVPIIGWSSNSVASSDTDTRVVAMQVQQAAPTATITGSASLVKFTSGVSSDTHGGFSVSTGLYTVPVTGYYRCTAALAVAATYANTQVSTIYIAKNGSATGLPAATQVAGAAEGILNPIISCTVLCNAGDTLSPQISSSATTPTVSSNANTNYFMVERLSGPAVVTATESVNARYHSCTATVTGSFSNVSYTTKDYDSHNAYSGSTYTVPVSGKYLIEASIIVSAASTHQTGLSIVQTGADVREIYASGGTTGTPSGAVSDVVIADQLSCIAGDTLIIKVLDNGTTPTVSASTVRNVLTIARVGN